MKFLCGLEQPLHAWDHKVDACFLFEKFERSFANHSLYFNKAERNSFMILILYVDDVILIFNYLFLLRKKRITQSFEKLQDSTFR